MNDKYFILHIIVLRLPHPIGIGFAMAMCLSFTYYKTHIVIANESSNEAISILIFEKSLTCLSLAAKYIGKPYIHQINDNACFFYVLLNHYLSLRRMKQSQCYYVFNKVLVISRNPDPSRIDSAISMPLCTHIVIEIASFLAMTMCVCEQFPKNMSFS